MASGVLVGLSEALTAGGAASPDEDAPAEPKKPAAKKRR
jgi:hypothetical protein